MTTENLNAKIIDANWKAKPSERARVRFNGVILEKAICKGIEKTLLDSEYGQLRQADGISVWFSADQEPPEWGGELIISKVVEVETAGQGFSELRVLGRGVMQGGVQLVVSTKDAPR